MDDLLEGMELGYRWPVAMWRAWDHGDGRTSQKRAMAMVVENLISLITGGNKSGKSALNLALGVVYAFGGDHPATQEFLRANDLPLDMIPDGPGVTWFLAPSHADSKRYHRARVEELCGVDPTDDTHTWWDRNADKEARLHVVVPGYDKPAVIIFKAHSQGVRGMKGDNIRYLGVDEECPELMFNQAVIRLGEDMRNRAVFSMTPDVLAGISWVKGKFIDADYPGADHAEIWVEDNPHIPEGAIEARVAGMTDVEKAAALRGKFGIVAGAVYPRFSRGVHSIEAHDVPDDWPRYIGQDFGMDNPNATVWGALAPDGWIEIYREYYKAGMDGSQIGEVVKQMCEDADEYIVQAWCDPSNLQTVSEFRRASGINAGVNGKRDVEHGIKRVKVRLAGARLRIHRSCTRLLSEMEAYRRGRNGKPIKRDDHGVDALRYLAKGIDDGGGPVADWTTALDSGELVGESTWMGM